MKSLPVRLDNIRSKEVVNVTFVVHEAAMWKTELLYIAMLAHRRFNPTICVAISNEELPASAVIKYNELKNYLDGKGYEYKELISINETNPDLVFYSKPYDVMYAERLSYRYNRGLTLSINYGFTMLKVSPFFQPMVNNSAMVFVENSIVRDVFSRCLMSRGKNIRVTGLPMGDMLMMDAQNYDDPWKCQAVKKKRIIWAPHFTIHSKLSRLDLSSFLALYEAMPELANKYENEIQIAFKPHPILYPTLIKEWGKEKTDQYYGMWDAMDNGQTATGEYAGLFKHSDAMIHDCASFLIEYLFMDKPVMYTLRDLNMLDSFNDLGLKAYDSTYHGTSAQDVEEFINMVIREEDPMLPERAAFKGKYLTPPNGKTACQNIIDAILGENGYR